MFSYLGKWIPRPAATVLPKMAAPPTVMKLTSISTTINSLPTELLIEVLLRIPTPAALIHAVAASRSWRGAIATAEFLTCYRKHHKSLPFLGLYFRGHFAGPPSFEFPDSIHCAADDTVDRDLKDAALKAVDIGGVRRYQDHRLHDAVDSAFIHRRLGVHPDCCLLDCHNSRRLLTRGGEALEVRSPLARETILLPFPPDVVHPDSLQACLLQGHDEASSSSFRVVYLQHRYKGCKQQVRAVEYDSSRKSWQDHPWETLESNIKGTPGEVMHAGHRIFCKYIGWTVAALLLDTRKMEFSVLPLPSDSNFTIGEIEDNACGLVETVGYERQRLRVWQLDEEKLDWKLKKDIEMGQVLGEHDECYHPCAISNGIALVCSVTTCRHVLVDLNTCSMKNKFKFRGRSAYLMQMPWPPAFSRATANGGFGQDGGPTSDRTEAGESDEIERSPGPSLGGSFGTDPTQKVKKSDVQIATSCCTEASAASTVSSGECKPLLGGSGSAIKFTDSGKQPIIDVSITSASSLSDLSVFNCTYGSTTSSSTTAGGDAFVLSDSHMESKP